MSVYLQLGYGKGDKVETALKNNSISGVILSPRDEKRESLESFVRTTIAQKDNIDIILDPQVYYSTFTDAVCKNLGSYEYFPGIVNQSYFRFRNIRDVIERCLNYQKSIGLKKLISPNILVNSFSSREAQTVLNFADEASQIAKDLSEPVLVSLTISETAFNENANLNSFLNELTTIDIDGFYVTIARTQSQYDQYFESALTIKNIMYMMYSLSEINGYEVIMGYTDVLGVLFKPFGIKGLGTGWHNSSRKFTVKQKILPSSGGRLPRERYTSVNFLNSLYLSEIDTIVERFGINSKEFKVLLSNTPYDHLLSSSATPSTNWNRSIGHLQHWCALQNIYDQFDYERSVSGKLDLLEKKIKYANGLYTHFKNNFIQFESSSSNRHLSNWEEALNTFRQEFSI